MIRKSLMYVKMVSQTTKLTLGCKSMQEEKKGQVHMKAYFQAYRILKQK